MQDEMTIDDPGMADPAKSSDTQSQEVVSDPAKISGTDNQEGREAEVETGETGETGEPVPYTFEELNDEKVDFKTLDPKRVPKSYAKLLESNKSLQGESTKIQQRLAAQEGRTPGQRPTDPHQGFAFDVFQAFDQGDDMAVSQMVGSLNNSIEDRILEFTMLSRHVDILTPADAPEAIKLANLENGIKRDREFKKRLDNALVMAYQDKQTRGSVNQTIDTELYKAIPDLDAVAPEMGKFAANELKLSKGAIEGTMNPLNYNIDAIARNLKISKQQAMNVVQEWVIEMTKGMHVAYMRMSGKGLRSTENREPPTTPGEGGHGKETNTNLISLRKKAFETGDMEDLAAYYTEEARENRKEKLTRR